MYSIPQQNRTERASVRGLLRQKLHASFRTFPTLLRKILPGAAFYFLLSIAQCFYVPSPYSVCCLAASAFTGLHTDGAMAGLLAGLMIRIVWNTDWDTAQFLCCAICCLLFRLLHVKKQRTLMILTFLILVLRALPGMLDAQNTQTLILSAAGVLTGIVSMPALIRAAQMIKEKRWEGTEDDLLCFLLPILLALTGASRIGLFSLNLGFLLAAYSAVMTAWSAGAAAGVCFSLGCGIALMMGGQSPLMLLWLVFASLAAGIFQGRNKALTALVFMASGSAIQFLSTFSLQAPLPLSAAAGCAAFLMTQGKRQKKLVQAVRRLYWHQPKENLYTKYRMQKWAGAIERMAKALPGSRIETYVPEEESESIAELLCDRCDQLPVCWRDRYETTKLAMQALAERKEEGENGYLSLINQYFSTCPRIADIPSVLEELDKKRLERVRRSVCADYEKEMLKTHLSALAQAAQRISEEDGCLSEEENGWLEIAEGALQRLRFPGHAAFVKRIGGRMTVCVQYDPLTLHVKMSEQLCADIGIRLGVSMEITEQKNGRIMLEEEPPLWVTYGMATACAVTGEKKLRMGVKPNNGDDILVKRLSGGKLLLALSDGMGHGGGAQDESRKTLELLSLCMESGYSREQAVKAVNGVMLSVTGGEKFATVDLCMVDLWNGRTAVNKLGACASFLIHGRKLHRIEGNALPLGIIEHVLPTESEVSLVEGDLMLMMSDGVTDAFQEEEDILSVFRNAADETPQHIADAVLREAIILQDGLPQDDMTVLCAQVVSRRPERQKRLEIMSA